jgi:hypothetical protein
MIFDESVHTVIWPFTNDYPDARIRLEKEDLERELAAFS